MGSGGLGRQTGTSQGRSSCLARQSQRHRGRLRVPDRFKVIASNRRIFPFAGSGRSFQDFVNPGLLPVELSVHSSARFLRIEATRLAKRSNDCIFALDELRVLNEEGLSVAEEKKVTALDSIEAPNRWTKANLTDGKWVSKSPSNDGSSRSCVRSVNPLWNPAFPCGK